MPRVMLMGWRPGVHVINVIKVLRKYTGLGLYEAKQAVDRSLTGEGVIVDMPCLEAAEAFAREAREYGAVVEVDQGE